MTPSHMPKLCSSCKRCSEISNICLILPSHSIPMTQPGTYRQPKPSSRGEILLLYDPLKASNRLYVYPINGKLAAYSSSPVTAAACALCAADVSFWSISSIGKYCVSTLDCSLGSNGARIRRRPSQDTPRKKGCCLISLAPPMRPRRCSASQMRLSWIVSMD
jgi:hypothetical protein